VADLTIALRVLFVCVPTWVLFSLFRSVMILIGWILVPVAVWAGAYYNRPSRYYQKEILSFKWAFMFPWGNEEDGIASGDWYYDAGSVDKQIIYWSCIRNPANNLRFVPLISCDIMPINVRFTGSFGEWLGPSWSVSMPPSTEVRLYDTKVPQWFLAWHGIYSCWYWQFMFRGELRRLWVGWKIYPTDVYGVTEYRRHGAGFATQFKVVNIKPNVKVSE
jgi:hypothetical protein